MALSDNCEAFWDFATSSLTDAINGHVLTATNISFESGSPGPCRLVDGASAVLRTTTLTLAEPFTVAMQVYVAGGASGAYTFWAYLEDGTNYWQIYQDASNNAQTRSRSGGSAGDANAGGVSGSVFNDIAGIYTSSTSRTGYRDSTVATDTTSITPSGASTNFAINALWDGGTALSPSAANWRYKNVAVWSRALTETELDDYFASPSDVLAGGGSSTTPLNVISPSQGIAFASAARRFC